jgi:membrane protein required for colicin V production
METFTWVDGVVLALVAVSALLAYARGLVRELLSIAGWVGAAVAAFVFAPAVEPLIREVPVLSDIIGTSCELGVLTAFAVVFAAALIVFSIFTPLVSGLVANSAIGPVDQAAGLLFGVARGVLLVLIAFLVYQRVLGGEGGFAAVDTSRTHALMAGLEQGLANRLPEDAPGWVAARYEDLTRNCR